MGRDDWIPAPPRKLELGRNKLVQLTFKKTQRGLRKRSKMIRKLLAATAIAALVTSSALAQSSGGSGGASSGSSGGMSSGTSGGTGRGAAGGNSAASQNQGSQSNSNSGQSQQDGTGISGRVTSGNSGGDSQGLGAPTNGGTAGAANGVGTPGAAGNQAAMPGSWSGSIGTAFFNSDMTLRSETDIRQNWSALSAAQQQQVRSDCQNINTNTATPDMSKLCETVGAI